MNNYIQLISRILKLILVFLVVGIVYWSYQHFDTIKHKFYETFVPHQTIWASTPIVESIRDMKQLVAASYYEELVKVRSKDRIRPLPKEELVIIYEVTIEAGFDLSHFSENNIKLVDDTAIYVNLPVPRIFEPRCNPSDQTVFHDSNSWSEAEQRKMMQSAKEEAEHNAKSAGLIDQAMNNGCRCISQLLYTLGFKEEHVHVFIRN